MFDKQHDDRNVVDLLFFPTGGGKTEAYLGLAAWTIAFRRLSSSGKLGAGVTVLMRYTLRLLTLDQLGRATGVVCALELMRGEPIWQDDGRPKLGTWPIEIGLYVGSAASLNSLGGKGNTGQETAIARIKRFQKDRKEAPAPLQACPWCGTPFSPKSFSLAPNALAPQNMELRCVSEDCAFTGDRPLPVIVVDEGLFVELKSAAIEQWLEEDGPKMHIKQLMAGFRAWEESRSGVKPRSAPYALLHSLSHALMSEIALDCGYPASTLKERIYALPAMPGGAPRCGLLIYTATAGMQGTLGGLVEVTERFGIVLASALRRLEVCSSDPVCADHDGTQYKDDRATHGAACHGCLLVAETSCEARNLFLDRALLVETMSDNGKNFSQHSQA